MSVNVLIAFVIYKLEDSSIFLKLSCKIFYLSLNTCTFPNVNNAQKVAAFRTLRVVRNRISNMASAFLFGFSYKGNSNALLDL
jgi:hypothetical protein